MNNTFVLKLKRPCTELVVALTDLIGAKRMFTSDSLEVFLSFDDELPMPYEYYNKVSRIVRAIDYALTAVEGDFYEAVSFTENCGKCGHVVHNHFCEFCYLEGK